MKLLSSKKIAIKEPSDLATDGNFLYTVSDKTNKIYKLTFQGDIVYEFEYEGNDLEGITVDTRDGSFWICEEKKREIIHLDKKGRFVSRHPVKIKTKNDKNGLEGICFDVHTNHLWVVNEKKPGLLIELDSNFDIIRTIKLDYAKDYSGICYDAIDKSFWLVSDESKMLINFDPDTEKAEIFNINLSKAEGVVKIENNIYIIDDQTSILYKFKFEQSILTI